MATRFYWFSLVVWKLSDRISSDPTFRPPHILYDEMRRDGTRWDGLRWKIHSIALGNYPTALNLIGTGLAAFKCATLPNLASGHPVRPNNAICLSFCYDSPTSSSHPLHTALLFRSLTLQDPEPSSNTFVLLVEPIRRNPPSLSLFLIRSLGLFTRQNIF